MADDPQYEDQIIRRVFAISLRDQDADAAANPPVIYLKGLAEASMALLWSYLLTNFDGTQNDCNTLASQELKSEGSSLTLNKDTIDRAIMARLLDAPEQYPQWPLHYLIGCYGRGTAEIRALSTLRDKDAASKIQLDIQYCKELIASNAGLLLTMSDNLFPQVCGLSPHSLKVMSNSKSVREPRVKSKSNNKSLSAWYFSALHCPLPSYLSLTLYFHLQPKEALTQGPLQLLDGLLSSDSSLPAGFLEDLTSRIEPEDLINLMIRLSTVSAAVLISSVVPALLAAMCARRIGKHNITAQYSGLSA